jgi:DNA invertase Pin-like site-specific DNA recombinase
MPRALRFGYGRVSSKDQHLDVQEARLEAVCDRVYLEKGSGTSLKRPKLQEVLERLDAGDVLVVAKLDRLARSVADLYHIVRQLKARGATLEVLDQPMDLDSFTGKIVFAVLGLVAELETNLRHERQMAGIQAAQAKGVHFGRKPALTPAQVQVLWQRRGQGATIGLLMQEFQLGKSAICRYLTQGRQGDTQAAAAD